MKPLEKFSSKVVILPNDDIDTDQIIPARFLKVTDKKGLSQYLFADWRERPGFPLMQPQAKGAEILLAGKNFGCGSSREHAPWALVDWGFRAIIAPSFADIFRNNSTKNGLLPIALGVEGCQKVERAVQGAADAKVTVDLASDQVTLPDGTALKFSIDSFARHCLLNGLDELGYILSFEKRISEHERST
jgi:3-isopropylmalate/(R)-2-methylmalate dehydratase small subunit